jgi:colicin import membrane protein
MTQPRDQKLRLASLAVSAALHLGVALWYLWTPGTDPMVRLDVPTYQVELVTLESPEPAPAPVKAPPQTAPQPEPDPPPQDAEPQPEPEPAPRPAEPVAPQPAALPQPPKPEVEVSEEKTSDTEDTPEPEPAPEPAPAPSPPDEDVLAEALDSAKQRAEEEASRARERERREVARELAELRRQVGERPRGDQGGQSASNLVQVYGRIVEQIVKANWRYPQFSMSSDLQATVRLSLAPDGRITDYDLARASGRPDFDASALKAVAETEQLPAPPGKDIDTLEITFNLQDLQ